MATKASQYDPYLMYAQPVAVTAVGGAVTSEGGYLEITTDALVNASLTAYTLTLTNAMVTPVSVAVVSVKNGTNAAGNPVVSKITPASGSLVVDIANAGLAAFNGTLVVTVMLLK